MDSAPADGRAFRYYDLLLAGFVTVILCSNLIGVGKTVPLPFLDTWAFGVGNLVFPVSYIFGDIMTEVYGYARSRRAIWAGFGAMVFASLFSLLVIYLPTFKGEPYNLKIQPAIELAFGNTWRITLASFLAFWAGDFANSFVLAKMKIWTQGRHLWTRTIGSTVVGQAVDSVLFYPLAMIGFWQPNTIVKTVLLNWAFKVTVEVVFTPLTYAVVGALKRAERSDFYDVGTNFTPFSLKA
jgi:uncharacterized integral membrane protein (TIGR00697 family)